MVAPELCGSHRRIYCAAGRLVLFTTTSCEKVTIRASSANAGMPETRSSATNTPPRPGLELRAGTGSS
jgi:hypothetical protein